MSLRTACTSAAAASWAWVRRHGDWILALVLCALATGTLLLDQGTTGDLGGKPRPVDAAAAVLSIVATIPVAWRRRRPALVLALCTTAVTVFQLRNYPSTGQEIGALVAAYAVGAYSANRRRVTRAATAMLGALALLNIARVLADHKPLHSIGAIVGNTVIFGSAFVMGDNVRRRRQRIADLEEHAAHATREREMLGRQALAEEQRRIARELHDVVAHSLSVMVVQAGAARRVLASRPEQASTALATIEVTGRDALNEMRRLLGVLRGEDAASMAPQPSLDQLHELASADPSLPVTVAIDGTRRPLPPAVDLQAFRIVQEALTNVRKHAGPATASVRIDYRADHVEVTVSDDGRCASVPAPDTAGHGLVGMRERVSLVGGTLQAGPRPGGGWLVRASLPVPAAMAVTAAGPVDG